MKAKINFKNILHYMMGMYRYKLYYSRLKKFIPKHILQQIEYRINSMDKKCYNDGSCFMCGCRTTALQMANKSCDKPCYPTMMSKYKWDSWKKSGGNFYRMGKEGKLWRLDINNKKFNRYE